MLKFFEMFRRGRAFQTETPEKNAFLRKYRHFTNLLAGNNQALEIMAELEQICYGSEPFTLDYVTGQVEKLQARVYDIAEDLNAMSGGKYPELFDAVERIGIEVLRDLAQTKKIEPTALTLPLQMLSLDRVSEVGGKAANLGEIFNRVHLPVPRGFAVTAFAAYHFLASNGIYESSSRILRGLDINDTQKLVGCCREIQDHILDSPLPPELEEGIRKEMESLVAKYGPNVRVAVRSSATSEDSEASFAGQHSTVLGATKESIVRAYKEVVASTFNPRAVFYRRSKGYPDDHVIMSVLCVTMVNARASGVMYTRDPNDLGRDVVLINSVWGLGVGAVDGSLVTDYFEIEKAGGEMLTCSVPEKRSMMVLDGASGLKEVMVPEDFRNRACLNPDQLMSLFEYGLLLEEHYDLPLDIEWALDQGGEIVLLQARPLGIDIGASKGEVQDRKVDIDELLRRHPANPVLLRRGTTASRGKASGLAYVLTSDHNLLNIPEGSILIAPQTSPRYVAILGRVQAIVTDVGSVTGHMASVAREFNVPTLVGTGNGTSVIPHGEEITVDATNCIIFKGRVESILERKRKVNPMKGSPTYKTALAALKKIAVLNLVDPDLPTFNADNCSTMHDVVRFAHEMSMRDMFEIADRLEVDRRSAVQIKATLPMRILAIDLGGGLAVPSDVPVATVDQVTSRPFKALLSGMLHPDVQWVGTVDVDLKGFAAILSESMLRDTMTDDRMGGPNYVLLSEEYLNFNSRLGYHFAVVDAFSSDRVNDNYIIFSFKGGAADIGRRSRRAILISKILKRLGLKTLTKGDMVRGEMRKYDRAVIEEKLDIIGRLLGSMRLLDMVLSDEGRVDWYVEEFLKGNYTFRKEH